jgi:dolichol-phosphate mannosyltransferase
MDADFSHDPGSLPDLLQGLENNDLVIGSRYLGGIRILNWSLWRLLLSLGANRYVRFLLRFDVGDCTSGYRAYRSEVLRQIDFERVKSNGYSFLVEILEAALSAGYRAAEVPIVYEDRQRGESKMDRSVMLEAAWKPWALLIRRWLRSRSATQTERAR